MTKSMGLGIVKTSWTTVILPPYSSSIILGYLYLQKNFHTLSMDRSGIPLFRKIWPPPARLLLEVSNDFLILRPLSCFIEVFWNVPERNRKARYSFILLVILDFRLSIFTSAAPTPKRKVVRSNRIGNGVKAVGH